MTSVRELLSCGDHSTRGKQWRELEVGRRDREEGREKSRRRRGWEEERISFPHL